MRNTTPLPRPVRVAFTRVARALVACALLAGCGADPPTVADVEPPAAECRVPDPPAVTPDPAPASDSGRFLPAPRPDAAPAQVIEGAGRKTLGPGGLKGLRPQDGPKGGLPLTLPQLMDARHPPTDMQWRALPPGSDAALTTIIADADEDPKVRARAMHGLSVRAPEGGEVSLITALGKADAEPAVRRAAARALGHGYVGQGSKSATEALGAALADDDARLRETTVKALAPHAADPQVRALLEKRAKVEQSPLVKEALAAALANPKP